MIMSNDPTFRVIAEHRRIFKAWQKASCPENGSMYELYFNASNQLCLAVMLLPWPDHHVCLYLPTIIIKERVEKRE
jgi:hypothetical protein